MAARTAAAGLVANRARLSTPKSAANSAQASILIQRRGFAGCGCHHNPSKDLSEWNKRAFVVFTTWLLCLHLGIGCATWYKKFTREESWKGHSDLEDAVHRE